MSRILKRLFWTVVAVAAALCLTAVVYLGVRDARETIAASSTTIDEAGEQTPSQQFRTVREQLRAMQKAQLNEIAHDASADAELVAMAQRQLLELYQREEQETTIQGILEMQGWEDPIVTVHSGSVNVLLQAEIITRQESSAILDLVCRETGVLGGNVKIIPIN